MASNFTNSSISAISLHDQKYNLKLVPFHATEAEWLEINYVPKQAEIILYDIDQEHNYLRFKIGDGLNQVKSLPFSIMSKTEAEKYIDSQIASAGHLKRVVLDMDEELPSIDEADRETIYMKKSSEYHLVADVYDEYMVINDAWEIIGNTRVDLSGYLETITTGIGLKETKEANNTHIEIDTEVVFICNKQSACRRKLCRTGKVIFLSGLNGIFITHGPERLGAAGVTEHQRPNTPVIVKMNVRLADAIHGRPAGDDRNLIKGRIHIRHQIDNGVAINVSLRFSACRSCRNDGNAPEQSENQRK